VGVACFGRFAPYASHPHPQQADVSAFSLVLFASIKGISVIFESREDELKDKFSVLFSLISKETQTNFMKPK